MKADKAIATYRRMRSQPLWRLLASDNGPTVIGLLQSHLYESERSLPSSIMHERIGRDLETIRAQGDDFPQTAQAYIANWLALVIQALVKLAEDTDTDKQRRIDRLKSEQDRIEKEIAAIQKGQMRVLPQASALERIREIISLTDDLTGDFRRVRDQFDKLNRDLRERLMDTESSRGDVLASVFAGIDLISDSDAGRTFSAFWRLLTDHEQGATLEQALDSVMSREFVAELDVKDRRFLLRMTHNLLEQGGAVHEVLQTFARSLKNFVQSREYLEQRRINQLLKDAQRAALTLKDEIKATEALQYTLELTSSRLKSLSQWVLYDPLLEAPIEGMQAGEALSIDLESIGELVAQSEIDFRSLKANVRDVLKTRFQASIGDVLEQYPAAQGLGSIIGLIALGSRHGIKADRSVGLAATETVSWLGDDAIQRRARILKIFFLQEKTDELV